MMACTTLKLNDNGMLFRTIESSSFFVRLFKAMASSSAFASTKKELDMMALNSLTKEELDVIALNSIGRLSLDVHIILHVVSKQQQQSCWEHRKLHKQQTPPFQLVFMLFSAY